MNDMELQCLFFCCCCFPKSAAQCTAVRFASFLSSGFTIMAVINPPERKLAKRTSVQWTDWFWKTAFTLKQSLLTLNVNWHFAFSVMQKLCMILPRPFVEKDTILLFQTGKTIYIYNLCHSNILIESRVHSFLNAFLYLLFP